MARSLPILFVVGLVLGCFGVMLLIVSMGTPEWMTQQGMGIGLFKTCLRGPCLDMKNPSDELMAVRVLEILGCVAASLGVGAAVAFFMLYMTGAIKKKRVLLLVAAIACEVASVFAAVGVIVYGATVFYPRRQSAKLGFSFGLALTASATLAVAGILYCWSRPWFATRRKVSTRRNVRNQVVNKYKPVMDTPVTDTPVTDAPVIDTPITEAPVTNTTVTKTTVTKTTVTKTTVTNGPVTNTPVTKTQVTKTQVTNKQDTNTPITNTPVTNTPVVDTSVPKS